MKPRTIAISLLIVSVLATPVQAQHCNGVVIQIMAGTETIYIDDRSALSGYRTDVWFYLETNDIQGLQSGGEIDRDQGDWEPVLVSDWCDHWPRDQLII